MAVLQWRLIFLLLLWNLWGQAIGRREWTEIETYNSLYVYDDRFNHLAMELDPLFFSDSPSGVPTMQPSVYPSTMPTVHASNSPSLKPSASPMPSPSPSFMPSREASSRPSTKPSRTPSASPSADAMLYASNDPPPNPDQSYFNYDNQRNASWGPGYPELVRLNATYTRIEYQNNAWGSRIPPVDWYWNEFDQNGTGPWAGILANKNPRKNRCEKFGEQSPIDIRETGAECLEHHQIRTRRGDYTFSSGQIKPQILSNKLRLLFDRRPCPEIDSPNCTEPDPPQADFPNNWGGSTDLIHVDFKIPSEHLLYGERFDAEMQVVHLHPSRRRTPTRVSLMRASHTGYNPILQIVIDRFQYLFDDHAAQCANRTRHARNLMSETHRLLGESVVSPIDFESWGDFSTAHDAPLGHSARQLQSVIFSPHDEMLIPSIYFYGYQGSLTEPPCSEFVTWFVSDVPMQMSFLQLKQLKRIQFDYVDPHCNRTSLHFQGSNARPIQDTFGRAIWHCTPANFVADPPNILNNFI